MDLRSKECSGVNIVTQNIQPPTWDIRPYAGKMHFYVGKKYHALWLASEQHSMGIAEFKTWASDLDILKITISGAGGRETG